MSTSSDIRAEAAFLLGGAIAVSQDLKAAHQRTKSKPTTVWYALRHAIDHMGYLIVEEPSASNDIMLLDCKRELTLCMKSAKQMVLDLTPSREVENATDTPTTHA